MITLDSFNDSLVRCKDCKKYFDCEDINSNYVEIFESCKNCHKNKIQSSVTLEYKDDSEGNNNRGWQVDQITAKINSEEIGYIKLAYIPKSRFNCFYSSILDYLVLIRGKHVLPYEYRSGIGCGLDIVPFNKIPVDKLKKGIVSASISINKWVSSDEQTRLCNVPESEVVDEYIKLEKIAKRAFGKNFREFKKFHVDKPIVDYIQVEPGYRRAGVATLLYKSAYHWMKSKNMKLYASNMQSQQSKEAWLKIEQEFGFEIERTMEMRQANNRKILIRKYLK